LDPGTRSDRARTIRQDISFVVSILLLLMVIVAALTGMAGDEDEFFGLGDDLHVFAGWGMVILTTIHVLLRAGHMVRYAKRRLRRLLGVGSVVQSGCDESPGVK
jgi:Mn2+/Fe2+ NRAMP family transporter